MRIQTTMLIIALAVSFAQGQTVPMIENENFRLEFDPNNGVMTSFYVKPLESEMIGEKRLAASFRLCLPYEDYLCHYIEGREQKAEVRVEGQIATIHIKEVTSERGTYPVELILTVRLDSENVLFKSKVTNHSNLPISEFYYPQIGGWTQFGKTRDALLATPGYHGCNHGIGLFRGFPGGRGLGAECAEWSVDYPGLVMPWVDLFDSSSNSSLYMGYHDPTFRLSTWHFGLYPNSSGSITGDAWLTPEQAKGEPVGMVFSHVRYPFIHSGETLDSGEFVIRLHEGDWHRAARYYRGWFMEHFPFNNDDSWLRKKSAWFSSIIYQPEDKVIANYETFTAWMKDAVRYGVDTCEIIGWDRGGLERQYPEYIPEEKLGGREGLQKMIRAIHDMKARVLLFVNYNILDPNTDWYKKELHQYTHQDQFGDTPNWMAWGESTLLARKAVSVRRHRLASVTPEMEKYLGDMFVELVRDGADGLQIDKLVVGCALDFNPRLTMKPDVANYEGLIQSVKRVYDRCREINPEFRLAAEALQDRFIPFIDVYYRATAGYEMCPLKYAFPEWTAVQHVASPQDFNGINAAVVTGAVICMEPDSYQNSMGAPMYQEQSEYVKKVQALREELSEIIFTGEYRDTIGASINEVSRADVQKVEEASAPAVKGEVIMPAGGGSFTPVASGALRYKVHAAKKDGRRAIVVANASQQERSYFWRFVGGNVTKATLYSPLDGSHEVEVKNPLIIPPMGLHVLVEHPGTGTDGIKLMMACGLIQNEVEIAEEGYSIQPVTGFAVANIPQWAGSVNHCRAANDTLELKFKLPKGKSGMLRLYVVDPDNLAGGREMEIRLNGKVMETVKDFQAGRWLEYPMGEEETAGGVIRIEAVNKKPGANAPISKIEWVEK